LFCYRRRGHNEADEPSATQPLMYQVINKKATTRTLYADQLVQEKVLIVQVQIKWLKIIALI
jgi:2-oxoglutarate dehydrogenase E1 component